jgi:hypothetical protein
VSHCHPLGTPNRANDLGGNILCFPSQGFDYGTYSNTCLSLVLEIK